MNGAVLSARASAGSPARCCARETWALCVCSAGLKLGNSLNISAFHSRLELYILSVSFDKDFVYVRARESGATDVWGPMYPSGW